MRRFLRAIQHGAWYVRWVLAGRPPVHIDASLTAISVPYHEDDHAP